MCLKLLLKLIRLTEIQKGAEARMTVDINTIQFLQDIGQIAIGAVQNMDIGRTVIWSVHHLRLVTHVLMFPFSQI